MCSSVMSVSGGFGPWSVGRRRVGWNRCGHRDRRARGQRPRQVVLAHQRVVLVRTLPTVGRRQHLRPYPTEQQPDLQRCLQMRQQRRRVRAVPATAVRRRRTGRSRIRHQRLVPQQVLVQVGADCRRSPYGSPPYAASSAPAARCARRCCCPPPAPRGHRRARPTAPPTTTNARTATTSDRTTRIPCNSFTSLAKIRMSVHSPVSCSKTPRRRIAPRRLPVPNRRPGAHPNAPHHLHRVRARKTTPASLRPIGRPPKPYSLSQDVGESKTEQPNAQNRHFVDGRSEAGGFGAHRRDRVSSGCRRSARLPARRQDPRWRRAQRGAGPQAVNRPSPPPAGPSGRRHRVLHRPRTSPVPHLLLLHVVPGGVEAWERAGAPVFPLSTIATPEPL